MVISRNRWLCYTTVDMSKFSKLSRVIKKDSLLDEVNQLHSYFECLIKVSITSKTLSLSVGERALICSVKSEDLIS